MINTPERPRPPGNPEQVRLWGIDLLFDKANHVLYSLELGQTPRLLILVTGYPEGKGELANSAGVTLEGFFKQANNEIAMAQVYTGSRYNPRQIVNLSKYLKHTLDIVGNSTPVDLVVYSAGAMSLTGIPQEYFDRINSLTFISPVVEVGSIKKVSESKYARFLKGVLKKITGIPSINEYFKSITPLIEDLQQRSRSVNLILGEKDDVVNNGDVQKAFHDHFAHVPITFTINSRNHATTVEEVLTPVS
ncbi:MAG: hypothetical protein PHV63_04365 [Candidatus Daviesbacteria bacterium]|nr:hypothetical protein [Candidatus Daviesbacteria bacterium]